MVKIISLYMNNKLRTEAKNDFEKDFFKLMNNAVFGKTMKNVRKDKDIELVTTNKRRNYLVSELNSYEKILSENLSAKEMKKIKVKMNKPEYLGLSILEISKRLMYEFWYQQNAKLCYMDTDSFIIHIKTEDWWCWKKIWYIILWSQFEGHCLQERIKQ